MKNSIFRSILIGILFGLLVFMAARLVIVLLIIATIFKLSGKGRGYRSNFKERKFAFAERVRNMNEDEYTEFKTSPHHHHC